MLVRSWDDVAAPATDSSRYAAITSLDHCRCPRSPSPGTRLRATREPMARQMPVRTTSADSAAPAITSPIMGAGSSARATAGKTSLGAVIAGKCFNAKKATNVKNGNMIM